MFTVYTVFFWAKNNTDHKKNLKHLKRTVWQDKPITSCSNLLLATVEITALSCFKVETNKAVSTSSQFYYGWSYVFGWLAVPFLFLCGGSGIASIFKRPNVQASNNMQAVVPIITSSSVPYKSSMFLLPHTTKFDWEVLKYHILKRRRISKLKNRKNMN